MKFTLRAALLGSLAVGVGGITTGHAQTARPADTAPPAAARGDAARTERRDVDERSAIVEASALERGSNSFTEGQARSRIEAAGITDVQDLRKDDAGFWRGRGMQGGTSTEVAMDFRGRIAAGPGVASLGAGGASASGASPAATGPSAQSGAARPDGTPGNPPSTATGRAADRAQGETPRPDGTPGNPPGTAAGRALDRATGSNTTGANPGAPAPASGGTTR